MFERINPKETLSKLISLRDILLLAGVGSLGYGLYIVKPHLSYIVCGSLVILGGLIMKEK